MTRDADAQKLDEQLARIRASYEAERSAIAAGEAKRRLLTGDTRTSIEAALQADLSRSYFEAANAAVVQDAVDRENRRPF